jgi:hypothetical protein
VKPLHVWPQETQVASGQLTFASRVEDCEPFTLWFRTPEANAHLLCVRAESFVAGTVLLAMLRGRDLRVHAALSPSFLRNVEEFQTIWSCWDARFRRIAIVADSESEATRRSGAGSTPGLSEARAITMFSGGVDSCYTVWRHTQHLCGRRVLPIRSALMVEGFDPGHFENVLARAQKMLRSAGVETIRMATNFRFVIPLSYPHRSCGSGLAACLLLFQQSHTHGLIPASDTYATLHFPFGSTALTDPLLGTGNFAIECDGSQASRLEKLREIVQWPGVLENLRVCNQFNQPDRNCGLCEKCVRNILCLRVLGIHQPPCFPKRVSNRHIRRLRLRANTWRAMNKVLVFAREAGISQSWVRVLAQTLRREKFYQQLEPARERLKQKLSPKTLAALRAAKAHRKRWHRKR